jgi:TIR domain
MALLTKQQFAQTTQNRAGFKSVGNLFSEAKTAAKPLYATTIFLSHCHKDKSIMEEAVVFLRSMGANIYIDWLDESMPDKANAVTALKIKQKINSSDKFIFLATQESIASKWCNWEIGIGDTLKLLKDKLCLIPLIDYVGQWAGNEYLQMYPYVESNDFSSTSFVLSYPDGRKVDFEKWLKN